MKTNAHYSSIKPVAPEATNKDLLKALGYIVSAFIVSVILLAGVDLIDQLLIWFK